jgi:hypothetical protein
MCKISEAGREENLFTRPTTAYDEVESLAYDTTIQL